MQTEALEGGFVNAPVDAAMAFRSVMNAMARPGCIERLQGGTPPAPLSVAAGTLALTLCDADTPVYLAPGFDSPAIRDWFAFHTGAPMAARGQAMFAFGDWASLMPLADFPIGTAQYPDRSATLIVEVEALVSQGATLRGPGIRDQASLNVPDPQALIANAAQFPMGLDFFFCCCDQMAGLPRTTQLEGC